MNKIISSAVLLLAGCGAATGAQTEPSTASATVASTAEGAPTADPSTPRAPPVAAAPPAPAAEEGLNDLAAMTFGCPKAALNAAAREAAKAPSQGTYQFAYFGIVSDSHHAAYEVHFKSNYQAEPVLKYCVAIYCQQGWDPNSTKTMVTLMGADAKPGVKGKPGGAEEGATHCDHQMHAAVSRAH